MEPVWERRGSLASVSVCHAGVNTATDLIHLLIPNLRAAIAYGTVLLMDRTRKDTSGRYKLVCMYSKKDPHLWRETRLA